MLRTVRGRLLLIVALCVVPAIGSAVLRASDARNDLLDQMRRRVRRADRVFEAELDEDRSNAEMGASLVAGSKRLAESLKSGDARAPHAMVKALGRVYTDTLVAIAGADGRVLATNDARRAPKSLDAAAMASLRGRDEVGGLFPLAFGTTNAYAFVVAEPVFAEDSAFVGAVALLTPIDADYLEHIEQKAGANLAIQVNDVLVAACGDHPAPLLEAHGGGVVTMEKDGRHYALATFQPPMLQRPGQEVEVTASDETSKLLAEADADLAKSLGVLFGVLAVAVAIALWFARRMADAVRRISAAAAQVRDGSFVEASGVHTGDELETLANDFNGMVHGLQETERLKSSFGKFVTRQFIERILEKKPELGQGELVPVTVLFSDIRGFTSISEHMDPKELLEFLNHYFTDMVDCVMRHGGEVDKFIGDALMAVFGKFEPRADDPIRAVRAAMEMKARLKILNDSFRLKGLPEIRAGIGIHTGKVVAGLMGHHDRMEFAVLGDAVNLASRLESMTKEMGVDILLSEDTYQAIKPQIDAEPLRKIRVKGREQEVMVYRLVGFTGEIPALGKVSDA